MKHAEELDDYWQLLRIRSGVFEKHFTGSSFLEILSSGFENSVENRLYFFGTLRLYLEVKHKDKPPQVHQYSKRGITIRLSALDCPERGTRDGEHVNRLAQQFLNTKAVCKLTGAKTYDRLVGYCSKALSFITKLKERVTFKIAQNFHF